MDISLRKRQKAIFTTLVFAVGTYAATRLTAIPLPYYLVGLEMALLTLVLWFLDFDVRPTEYLRFLVPSFALSLIGFYQVLTFNGGVRWGVLVITTIAFYILLLSINILNVSTVRTVPLRKAALSTLFFVGIAMFFMWGLLLIGRGWGINKNMLAFWGLISLFGGSFLSLTSNRMVWLEMFLYALISAKIAVLINFWPATPLIAVGTLVGLNFIFLGIFQHHLEKNLKSTIIREYFIIGLLLLAAFFWL